MNTELLLWQAVGLILHEAAHAGACVYLGLKVKGIVICRKGIGVRREAGTPRQNAIVAAAGPLVNLLLLCLFWGNANAVIANLLLCAINLLPIPGSDGRRVWESLRLA